LSVAVETAAPESVVPDQTDLPDEITLELGGEQTLLLPSSAGAGYTWEAAVDDEAVVEASTKFEDVGAKGARRPKFGENELLTLRGRAEGRTAVRLVQRRTWEEGVAPIAAHALTVNVAASAEATQQGGSK
jgi:predicted secreted protein